MCSPAFVERPNCDGVRHLLNQIGYDACGINNESRDRVRHLFNLVGDSWRVGSGGFDCSAALTTGERN